MGVHSLYGKRFGIDTSASILYVDGSPLVPNYATPGGKVIYVDSAVGGSDGSSPSGALATLDEAFAKCTANKGDVIIVMPNHAETVTGAGGIDHDVAGVSVIGLGKGSNRPRILLDGGTTVTYLIAAADACVANIDFAAGHSNVATCFDVTAANAHIDNCKFRNNTTNEDFLVCVTASGGDNTADGLQVTDCDWYTTDTDDDQMISIIGDAVGVRIMGNKMMSLSTATAQLIIVATGKLLTDAEIGWNMCQNRMTAGELFISNNGTTNSGFVHNNYSGHADVTGAHDNGWATGGWRLFNNYSASVDTANGGLIPAVDVDL